MASSLHLLIPLTCAFVYVIAALTLKRATELGVGVWRTSFVANWAMFLVFLPWWFVFGGTLHPLADYWQPAVTGLCFLGGQVFIILAISRGDISITTPVMGSKVILVASFSSLLRVGDVPLQWWIGAGLSAAAVALLHAGEKNGQHRNVGTTVLLATASAASYGLGDVLMQKWVPAWGTASFFPPMFLIVGLYSCALIPFFRAPLRELSSVAWRWVGPGALLMALNNAGIVLTLGIWGGATAVNIVYSIRGLMSVVIVWVIGHWFASSEQHLAPRVLRFRLVSAAMMIAAIALVLV
jgi:drug/metabolite transporter (DMT)-like permease